MNQEHLAKLQEGVEAWNHWRWERGGRTVRRPPEPDIVDLSGADLSGLALSEADLSGADLTGANLTGADLYRAKLDEARLYRADLSGADVSHVHLYGTDLTRAILRDADLRCSGLAFRHIAYADLSGANLTWASLQGSVWLSVRARGAIFQDAILEGLRAIDCDFSEAKCTRALYSRNYETPIFREFGDTEFEALYGCFAGVEVHFERGVGLDVVGLVVRSLVESWEALHPDCPLMADEIHVDPHETVARVRCRHSHVRAVQNHCFCGLRSVLAGIEPAGAATDGAVPGPGWEELRRRLQSSPAPPSRVLGRMVRATAAGSRSGETRTLVSDYYYEAAGDGRGDSEETWLRRYSRVGGWQYAPGPDSQGLTAADVLSHEVQSPVWTACALSRHTEPEARLAVIRLMRHADPNARHEAALSAGAQGNVAAVPSLIALLADHEDDPRWSACWALVDIWTQDAIAAVRRVLSGEAGDRHMRETVRRAMAEYGRVLE